MRILSPDFTPEFHCLAGACPDSCCRQGWQIVVDGEHLAQYRAMPGALGRQVRDALTEEGGEPCFRMEGGTCTLLRPDGLCPIAAALGEEGLCHICHTHPRFIEEYGAEREIHFSMSCPEAARLTLLREAPLAYGQERDETPVTSVNDIDPGQYFALRRLRRFAAALMQERRLAVYDRLALLLRLAELAQPIFDGDRYGKLPPLLRRFREPGFRDRQLARAKRVRLRGASYLPEVALLRQTEHLGQELPALLHTAVFTARSGDAFDRSCGTLTENLAVSLLMHYIPKAVNDGDVRGRLLFAVFGCLFVRRMCVCTGRETPEDAAHFAGLFAKEIEHSEENVSALLDAWQAEGWAAHFTAQLPLPQKGEPHAV